MAALRVTSFLFSVALAALALSPRTLDTQPDFSENTVDSDSMENGLRVNVVDQREASPPQMAAAEAREGSSSLAASEARHASATHEVGPARLSLNRLFALVESERISQRGSPCPAVDQRSALTALLLAIVFPPSAHFYYGYTVLGVVQLVLTLLMYFPLFLACGWWWKPVQHVPRRPMCFDTEEDEAGAVRKRIQRRVTVLIVVVCFAVALAAVLTAWQLAMLVRIATHDLQPANGCPARQL
jgi:hypothetical protein